MGWKSVQGKLHRASPALALETYLPPGTDTPPLGISSINLDGPLRLIMDEDKAIMYYRYIRKPDSGREPSIRIVTGEMHSFIAIGFPSGGALC